MNIADIADKQREKGMKEYGQPLEEETEMNSIQILTAIEEELVKEGMLE